MSLGQLIGAGLKAYYKLDGLTDSSGNSLTLTNNNSVSFSNRGRFNNGADFGTTGTNKSLQYSAANILSSNIPSDIYCSFWFKLNSTADKARTSFVVFNTKNSTSAGLNFGSGYTISSGTLTIDNRILVTLGGGITTASINFPVDSLWHFVQMRIYNAVNISIIVDRIYYASNSFTLPISITGSLPYLSIGNNLNGTLQAYALLNELIVADGGSNLSTASYDGGRTRYYNQVKGIFCI